MVKWFFHVSEGKNDVLFDTIREEESCGDSPHQEDGQGKEDERVGEKKSTVVVATDTASELTEVMEVVGVDLRSVDSLDEELNGVNPAVEVEGVKEEEEEWKNSVLLLSHAKVRVGMEYHLRLSSQSLKRSLDLSRVFIIAACERVITQLILRLQE